MAKGRAVSGLEALAAGDADAESDGGVVMTAGDIATHVDDNHEAGADGESGIHSADTNGEGDGEAEVECADEFVDDGLEDAGDLNLIVRGSRR